MTDRSAVAGAGLRAPLVLLLVIAAAVFVVRGPVRGVLVTEPRTDFTGPYIGARAWMQGHNPYLPAVYWSVSVDAGWPDDDRHDGFTSRIAYPLPALVLLSPFGLLPWPAARIAELIVMTLLVVLAIGALASLEPVRGSPVRQSLFVSMALLLAPMHTAIGTGNPAAAAIALIALGVWAALRGHRTAAGVMLGAAACLKPPLAVFAIAYYIVSRQWRIVFSAAAVGLALLAVGSLRLQLAGQTWLADYLFNNRLLLSDHGTDVIRGFEFQSFLNLQYLGWMLFENARIANVAAFAVAGTLLLAWLFLRTPRSTPQQELLELSSLLVISLLPVYHRPYDAGLLLLPMCWAFAESGRPLAADRRLALVLLALFLLPSVTFLMMQTEAGRVPAWMLRQWWWNGVVITHQVWALLVLAIVLLAAQAKYRIALGTSRSSGAGPPRAPSWL